MKILKNIHLLKYIFPELCVLCHENPSHHHHLCAHCLNTINYLQMPSCPLCSSQIDTFLNICHQCIETKRPWVGGACALKFDAGGREVIHNFKYNGQLTLAHFLINKMYETCI